MSRTQLMSLMQRLYQDFHEILFKPNAYSITDTEFWLYVKTRDDYWPIGIKNMESIPRKGESFTVEFVGELWDGRYLKVESVTHEIENGVHRINIFVENPPLE